MNKRFRVLVIFPKATETIIAVFHNETCFYKETIEHVDSYFGQEAHLEQEIHMRKQEIFRTLHDAGINISKLDAVTSRGGLIKPVQGGTYFVNEAMIDDLKNSYNGKHATNLGAIIANEIAMSLNIDAFIVDPPVVNELGPLAVYSGLPEIKRKSIFHALNQKAAARKAADELQTTYESINVIVAHIGYGITIGAHEKGKVIDVNNGLHGDGPFSVERAGSLPTEALISLCFSNSYDETQLIKKISFESGLKAYLQCDDLDEIIRMIERKEEATKEIVDAMAYQIGKEIGAMAVVLNGDVDAIILTGEFSRLEPLTTLIVERVNWIADIFVYPGEQHLQALNDGSLRVLRNDESAKIYP